MVQLTKIQFKYDVFAAPDAYSPIQSVAVGLIIPLPITLANDPRLTVLGIAPIAGPAGGTSLSAIFTVALFGLPVA